MNVTAEACGSIAYRCPRSRSSQVGAHDEVEVGGTAHGVLVEQMVVFELMACGGDDTVPGGYARSLLGYEAEVIETFQEVKTVFALLAVVVDVYLRYALTNSVGILVVYVVVVFLGIHHRLEVVVVGNRELHWLRVCLAHVALGVVCQIVAVLVVVHRCLVVLVLTAVTVKLGIALVGEYLPTATDEFVCARRHPWLVYAHGGAWQYGCRRQKVVDDRCATLKLQVDVDDVHLVGEAYVLA